MHAGEMNIEINMKVNFLQIPHSLDFLGALGELEFPVFEQKCPSLMAWLAEAWGRECL